MADIFSYIETFYNSVRPHSNTLLLIKWKKRGIFYIIKNKIHCSVIKNVKSYKFFWGIAFYPDILYNIDVEIQKSVLY